MFPCVRRQKIYLEKAKAPHLSNLFHGNMACSFTFIISSEYGLYSTSEGKDSILTSSYLLLRFISFSFSSVSSFHPPCVKKLASSRLFNYRFLFDRFATVPTGRQEGKRDKREFSSFCQTFRRLSNIKISSGVFASPTLFVWFYFVMRRCKCFDSAICAFIIP